MKKILAYIYNYLHYRVFTFRPMSFFHKKDKVSLPKADGYLSHEDIQWWYWTGHLQGENGEKFGFELVFFVFNSWIVFKNTLAQAAISDISGNQYKFREEVEFLILPKKIPNRFELFAKTLKDGTIISALGGDGSDELYFKVENYEVKLNLKELYSPVIHYDGNKHKYPFGGNTYYYSRENMETKGVVIKDGKTINVKGTSWFDKQYGELYQAIFKGWQWFAISLNDGTKIMLYYFAEEYKDERYGSITNENDTKDINGEEFTVEVLKTWKSPNTEIVYPGAWKATVKGEIYFVTPMLSDQELRVKHHFWVGPEYWEGACVVKDADNVEVGNAYVELNGYSRHKILTIEL